MRYLPVFLDLQSGKVLLFGAGELARAKLRLLAAAGAEVRWYATDGNHELAGLAADDIARIEPTWTTGNIIDEQVALIRAQVGDAQVICGLSGGVDSAVAASLVPVPGRS